MDIFFKQLPLFLRSVQAQNLFTDEPPELQQIAVVVSRVFNFFVLSVGVVLVALIFVSSIKFAMAQGDPKAVEGAKKTLTYAVLGFILVVGVYTLLILISSSLLGETPVTPGGLIDQIVDSILELDAILEITPASP